MPEQIQALLNKIIDWWKKFTKRQQILIVSISAVVIIAFIILGVVISRPTMIQLIACEDAKQAASVKTLLEENHINYKTSTDGYTYYIDQKDEATANVVLGSNDIQAEGYTMDDVIDGSFSTTEADKQKRYKLYLEERFAKCIEAQSNVEECIVILNIPEQDGTLIAQQMDAYASITVKLSAPMSEKKALGIAKYVATMLGNDDTNNITIIDQDGNTLFAGGEEASILGTVSGNQDVKDRARETIATEVKDVIKETKYYDNVEVGINLNMNFDEHSYKDYDYYVHEGQTQGYLDSYSGSSSTSNSGSGGVPGTDSNDDDTTYVTNDDNNTETSTEEWNYDYLPSEKITDHKDEVGKIDYDNSSISVACTTFVVYNEDKMKKDGTLEASGFGSFDEFVAQTPDRTQTEVSDDFIDLVANATGFSRDNITIIAYEVAMFQYSDGPAISLTDIVQILLAVLIFLMLGFVVFRSLKKEEEEPVEEELTIDELIASTKEEEELEDIGYTEKSEARILIEKFVDEKPEAVAQLLRNWLNEDWG